MILIVGAGAVGTILATLLAAAGREVRLYARPKDVEAFGAVAEIRVEPVTAKGAPVVAPRPALATSLDLAGARAVVIGVKHPDLAAVMDALPPVIAAGCTIVSMLNGLDAVRRLRARFPGANVVALSVMFNGQLLGPLHARITTAAKVVLGSRDPALAALFRVPGLEVTTADGESGAWGKLFINLANAICALTHTTYKDLLLDPDLRRVYVAVLDEASGALDAAGIAYDLPLAVPLPAYRWMLLHGGRLPWWFARFRNGVREGAYPSMVADVEAGRPTEVEQLNGEVVRVGRAAGFPTPVNATLVASVNALRSAAAPRLSPAGIRERCGL